MEYVLQLTKIGSRDPSKNYYFNSNGMFYTKMNQATRLASIDVLRTHQQYCINYTLNGIKSNKNCVISLQKSLNDPRTNEIQKRFDRRNIQAYKGYIRSANIKLEEYRHLEPIQFVGDVTCKKTVGVSWSSLDPYTRHCTCCGVIIPVKEVIELNSYVICPFCITRMAEKANTLISAYESEKPEEYTKYVSESMLFKL